MGPATSILISETFTHALRAEVDVEIQSLSDTVNGEYFWINGAPFIYSFGWEYASEQDDYNGLKSKIGWVPQDKLIFAAMRNQQEDYIYLGDLCVRFSGMLKGYVDFGLPLSDYTSDETVLSHSEHIINDGTSFLGPALMEIWRHHKDFWMVK